MTIVETVKLINIVQLIVREAFEISLSVNARASERFCIFLDLKYYYMITVSLYRFLRCSSLLRSPVMVRINMPIKRSVSQKTRVGIHEH